MKFLVTLVIGIAIGAAVIWIYQSRHESSEAGKIAQKIKNGAESARDAISDQWRKLRTEDITNELARTGRVIREKASAAGRALADATADARITAAIKGKLVADSGLASFSISVNTTDGVVTLSGSVRSADQVRDTIALALDVEGVTKVISTLQVKPG